MTQTNSGYSKTTIFAAAGGNIIWGFSFLFTQLAFNVALPEILLSVRFILAFLFMSLLLMTGKFHFSLKPEKGKILPLLVLALAEPCYFFCESYGILYTNTTCSSTILAAVPVFAMILGVIVLKEVPTRHQIIFSMLPVAGVLIITLVGSSLGVMTPLGVILLFGSCLLAAVYRILNKLLAPVYSSFERTYVVMFFSMIVFTLSALHRVDYQMNEFIKPLGNPRFLIPVLVLALFCSVVANLLVNYANPRLSVAAYSTFGTLVTVCSVLAGVLILGEAVTPSLIMGTVMILIGVWKMANEKQPKLVFSENRR